MHRALAASLALWLMPLGVVAQSFQFMPFAARPEPPMLPALARNGCGATGDLDGDGRKDIVVGDVNLHVLLRRPNEWAMSGMLGAIRTQPVLADLEGDGDLDVVCVPYDLSLARTLSLVRNTYGIAPGPWSAISHPLGSTAVQAAAVGDVDADGLLDLVVATVSGSATPSLVLLRHGPGLQFTLDTTSMPAGLPYALWLTLLDADGDGDLDVLASNATSGLRLLHNVAGAFVDATASLPPTRQGHVFLASGDFDADGRTDCVAALGNGDIDVLWGGASGFTFAAAVATGVPLARCWPTDFDGDGDLDLLVHGPMNLDVLWSQGNRQFTRTNLHLGSYLNVRLVADVDEDGLPDVVFSASWPGPEMRHVYAGRFVDSAIRVGIPPTPASQMVYTPPMPADVDGDGRTDRLFAGYNNMAVDHRQSGGRYRQSTSPVVLNGMQFWVWDAEVADLDGDGHVDIVVETDQTLHVLSNTGTGTFTSTLQYAVSSPPGGTLDGLRIRDIDGDGDLDIVQTEARGIVLTRNLGGRQYAAPAVVVPRGATFPPRCVEVADFDGDGDFDIVCDVIGSGIGQVAVNDGAGGFTPGAAFILGEATSIRAADFDGDGSPDLAVSTGNGAGAGPLRLFRNNGDGTFTERTQLDLPPSPGQTLSNVVTADFDEDGDIDVGAVVTGPSAWLLLLNDGSGRFANASASRVQATLGNIVSPRRLRAADVDDDGDIDWIVHDSSSGTTVLFNHLRQCYSRVVPRLGGVMEVSLFSGPSFGAPGLGLLGIGFPLPAPVRVPGLRGVLELDPTTLLLAAVVTSPVGVSTVFVGVPPDAALYGLELWLQGAILPSVGPPGFTNAVYEVILR